MPKLSRQERAELERQLAEDDEAEPEDTTEYEVGFPEGGYLRGRWGKIVSAARARGFKLEDDPPDIEVVEPPDPKAKPDAKPAEGGTVKRFGRVVG